MAGFNNELTHREDMSKLKNNQILLIHGTLDEQTPMYNTMLLSHQLTLANVIYKQQVG